MRAIERKRDKRPIIVLHKFTIFFLLPIPSSFDANTIRMNAIVVDRVIRKHNRHTSSGLYSMFGLNLHFNSSICRLFVRRNSEYTSIFAIASDAQNDVSFIFAKINEPRANNHVYFYILNNGRRAATTYYFV